MREKGEEEEEEEEKKKTRLVASSLHPPLRCLFFSFSR